MYTTKENVIDNLKDSVSDYLTGGQKNAFVQMAEELIPTAKRLGKKMVEPVILKFFPSKLPWYKRWALKIHGFINDNPLIFIAFVLILMMLPFVIYIAYTMGGYRDRLGAMNRDDRAAHIASIIGNGRELGRMSTAEYLRRYQPTNQSQMFFFTLRERLHAAYQYLRNLFVSIFSEAFAEYFDRIMGALWNGFKAIFIVGALGSVVNMQLNKVVDKLFNNTFSKAAERVTKYFFKESTSNARPNMIISGISSVINKLAMAIESLWSKASNFILGA